MGRLLIFHQDNHFFAEFRWQRKSHTLKTHTEQNHRIIFNLTFYTMSQFPVTLHTSFCVELNCTCFLYLERVWLLNLKPFIPGVLVVSRGIKGVRGKKGVGGSYPSEHEVSPTAPLQRSPSARPKGFSYSDPLIIFTSPWPICFNRTFNKLHLLRNVFALFCFCFCFVFNKWHGTS